MYSFIPYRILSLSFQLFPAITFFLAIIKEAKISSTIYILQRDCEGRSDSKHPMAANFQLYIFFDEINIFDGLDRVLR